MVKKKTSLFSLALVSAFSLGILASCSSSKIPTLNEKDGVYLTYNGKEYTIQGTFDDYSNSLEAAKAYYTALNNVFIQIAVDTTALIDSKVSTKIDNFYQTARDNAKNNGTSEKEEIEKAFETEGVSSEQELKEKYYLDEKKTENDKKFDSDENILTFRSDYINEKSPYVTKHILVKIDASSTNLYDGTISKDNAYKISNVIKGLASDKTYKNFGEVALRLSDDSSASSYGLISAPMELSTSFVNEYKLGLYAQDYLFNSNVSDSSYIKDKTNLVERTMMPTATTEGSDELLTVENVVGNKGITADNGSPIGQDTVSAFGIPYKAALDLAKYADKTKSDNNTTVKDAEEVNYPRNIVFNHYFNNRSVSYIYLDDSPETQQALSSGEITESRFQAKNVNLITYSDKSVDGKNKTVVENLGNQKKILCDEAGRPILVTRAGTSGDSGYEGIHFIVAPFDPFESVNKYVDTPIDGEGEDHKNATYDYTKVFEGLTTNAEKAQAVRNDYFNLTIPSLSVNDDKIYNKSLITSITASESKYYNTLADAVRTALKGTYGDSLEFVKYEANRKSAVDKGAVIPEEIDNLVNSYIEATRADTKFTQDRSLVDSWTSYLRLIDLQKSLSSRILPNSCIDEFNSGTLSDGGVCNVSK